MTGALRSEVIKLRTTRLPFWLAVSALALTLLGLIVTILTADQFGAVFELDSPEGIRSVFNAAGSGTLFAMVLGIVSMTGEFRYGTVTQTFLTTPSRGVVVTSKLITSFLAGAGLALMLGVVTIAVALPWLAAKDVSVSPFDTDVGLVLLGVLASTALYGLMGVGIGSLLRNQVAALVVSLVWFTVGEGLLIALLPEVGRWLPSGAAAALSLGVTPSGDLLPAWAGGLVFAGYGLLFAAIGSRFVLRRDIT